MYECCIKLCSTERVLIPSLTVFVRPYSAKSQLRFNSGSHVAGFSLCADFDFQSCLSLISKFALLVAISFRQCCTKLVNSLRVECIMCWMSQGRALIQNLWKSALILVIQSSPSGHYPCHVAAVVVPEGSRLIGVEGLKKAIRRISLVFQYLSTLWTTRARIIDYHNHYLYSKCSYLNGLVYFVVTLAPRS